MVLSESMDEFLGVSIYRKIEGSYSLLAKDGVISYGNRVRLTVSDTLELSFLDYYSNR